MASFNELIPPRRNEIITPNGGMTQRFAEYLEAVADTVNTNTDTTGEVTTQIAQSQQSIAKLLELEKRLERVVVTAASITARPFDTVICNNVASINVTLEPNPKTGDIINVKRQDAEVVVIGTIDGAADMTINVQWYSAKLVYNGSDWSRV